MAGFKEFILRGNVVDLAVGVMIGAAFASVVGSMTTNIISPIVGMFLPGEQAKDLAAWTIGDAKIGIGAFIMAVVNFVIQAAVIYFIIVKPFQHLMARFYPPPAAGEPPVTEVQLLTEIRDQLKKNASAAGAR